MPDRPSLSVLPPSALPLDLSLKSGLHERRGVGLLVVDLKDSTKLHMDLGNRKAHALVGAALDFAEESSAKFDGKVIRRLGDGYLIAFPSFGQALDAAHAIQGATGALRKKLGDDRVSFRAGVHGGRVLVDPERRDVFGATVEKALALAEQADGGEIVYEDAAGRGSLKPVPYYRSLDGLDLQPRLSLSRFERRATMFVGLRDWSPVYETRGKRIAHQAVASFHARAAEAIERAGGLVVKTEGETLMASFPTPASALRAAEEIRRTVSLKPRFGITWGRVLREDRLEGADYFGNYVNSAARMMRMAGDGEIVAGETLLDDPGAAAIAAGWARESAALKGFSSPVQIRRSGTF